MSNLSNTILMERAADVIDYFEGKIIAKIIETDLDRNDLESLEKHVNEAEAEIAIQEFNSYDAS